MSPVKSEVLTEPRLNVPPGSSSCAFESSVKRVSWNAISGLSSAPEVARPSQRGGARDEEIVSKASPISPETGLESRFSVVAVATAVHLIGARLAQD